MADDLQQTLDILTIASKIVGQTKTVIFDSGIYAHYCEQQDDDTFDIKKDIIKLRGSSKNPITLNDLVRVFKKMQKQFKILNKENNYIGPFFYEGIVFNKDKHKWDVWWGS